MPNTAQRILPLGISMAPGVPSTAPWLAGRYPTSRRQSAGSMGQGTLALWEKAMRLACRWKGKPLILVLHPSVPLPPPQTFL